MSDYEFQSLVLRQTWKRLEQSYYKHRKLTDQEIDQLQLNQTYQRSHTYFRVGLGSFLCSSGLLMGKLIPNFHRAVVVLKVGFYSLCYYTYRMIDNKFETWKTQNQFDRIVANGVMSQPELKKLKHQYSVKKAAIDEDRKALEKYKMDPQSYH